MSPVKSRTDTAEARAAAFTRTVLDQPERFLLNDSGLADDILRTAADLFDQAKSLEFTELAPLPELYIQDFPDAQIWEQLNLCNEPLLAKYTAGLRRLRNWVEELEDERSGVELDEHDSDALSADEETEYLSPSDLDTEEEEAAEVSSEEDDGEQSSSTAADDRDEESEQDSDTETAAPVDAPAQTLNRKKSVTFAENDRPQSRKATEEDHFFSFKTMDKYVSRAERIEMGEETPLGDSEDEEIDYFQDPDLLVDDEEEEDDDEEGEASESGPAKAPSKLRYEDFFDPADQSESDMSDEEYLDESDVDGSGTESGTTSGVRSLFDMDDEQAGGAEANLSRFERQQMRASKKIQTLEDQNVGSKEWTMIGEAKASDRPINSLLEQDLEFEQGLKPAPVITVDKTETLEEMIKRRILAREFDDVVRRQEVKETEFKPSEPELNDQKSKKSLAEVYEAEYQAEAAAARGDVVTTELTQRMNKQHELVAEAANRLHHRLDALCSFNYRPEPAAMEVKVVTNASAIVMEEVLPTHVSEATQLAPEEVYIKSRSAIKGDTERTDAERRKERLQKRSRQSAIHAKRGNKKDTRTAQTIAENTF